jgi:hypothetical protein
MSLRRPGSAVSFMEGKITVYLETLWAGREKRRCRRFSGLLLPRTRSLFFTKYTNGQP